MLKVIVLLVLATVGYTLRIGIHKNNIKKVSVRSSSSSSSLPLQDELLISSLLTTPLKPSIQQSALKWISIAHNIRDDIQLSSLTGTLALFYYCYYYYY